MEQAIGELARLRNTYAKEKAYADLCAASAVVTPEWVLFENASEAAKLTKQLIATGEERLRIRALAAYQENQNKTPLKGIAIKVYKRLVYDATQAEAWCRQNAPTTFKFDVKGFEKVAEKLPGAPVTVEEDPRVTLASDLSEYLEP